MMLRTSLPATGSIVKKSLLDCLCAAINPAGARAIETGKRGAMMFGCGEMGKVCGRSVWFGWLVSA